MPCQIRRVVLTTVTHLNGYVLRIHLAGQAEPLEPTNTHRLYSEDRDAWVPAGELTVGEHLRTLTGPAEITQIASRPGVHRVYNLEVETEHSYYVSTAGVLSHNANPCAVGAFWSNLKAYRGTIKTNDLRGSKKRYYEKDYTHGDLEVYNHNGFHLGSADMTTGEMIKPAVAGRKIDT